ncbi:MAG: FAD-dependent oxidoreductase, partial [Candidatus Eremiobacteraeota bacterium]|nr:FAD-dependent oxidoreductase [Candidatus Eremiobacteraeota bacterium]
MREHYNLIIAGGGPAGVAAAIAAKRFGINVLLIERYGFFGGTGTAALVQPWMAYKTGDKTVIGGIFSGIVDNLRESGGIKDSGHLGMIHHCFDPEILKMVLQEMLISAGVDLLLHTIITGSITGNGLITGVKVWNKSGSGEIFGDLFIDATGDADLAYYSDASFEKGRPGDGAMQPVSLHFRIGGVDESRMPDREKMTDLYIAAKNKGKLSCPRENLLWFDTPRRGEIHFNTTRVPGIDGTSGIDLTRAELESRKQMRDFLTFLKKEVPGFENC